MKAISANLNYRRVHQLLFLVFMVVAGAGETKAEASGISALSYEARVYEGEDGVYGIGFRDTFMFLGYEVSWNEALQKATAQKDDIRIEVYAGRPMCMNNGTRMYLKEPAFAAEGSVYLPASFFKNILEIDIVSFELSEDTTAAMIYIVHSPVDFAESQREADQGRSAELTVPGKAALAFVENHLGFHGEFAGFSQNGDKAALIYTKTEGGTIHISLFRPVGKGAGGIWAVDSWIDEEGVVYGGMDLSKLPPLFQNDRVIPEGLKGPLREIITGIAEEALGMAYDVQAFRGLNVGFLTEGTTFQLTFDLDIVLRSYYENPDEAVPVLEAKEAGQEAYKKAYGAYNLSALTPMGAFKMIGEVNADGSIDAHNLKILRKEAGDNSYEPLNWGNYRAIQ